MKKICAGKLYNLLEKGKFLEKHKLLKLTQKRNRKSELEIKTPKKCSGPDGFPSELYQIFRK